MSSPTTRPLDRLTILIIDDHRDTVDILQEYLASAGATVVGAGSAKAGLAVMETHVPDVILADLRMPGEDGRWFLRELRASRIPGAASVPVFALSGERDDLQAAQKSDFAAYFLKPVDLDVLVRTLAPLPCRSR